MTRDQRGFTLVEMPIALAIGALIALGAAISIFQVMESSPLVVDRFTTTRSVQNAAHWISRDAESAENVRVDDLVSPDFLALEWTVYSFDEDPSIYHTVTYSFVGLSQGVGKLQRYHWSSDGINETTVVAEHVYYDPADPTNTSKASYQDSQLTVKIASRFRDSSGSKEYIIVRRPNLF